MALGGGRLGPLEGVALLRLHHLPRVVHAEDGAAALAAAAPLRAGRPRPRLPQRAGQVGAGLDVNGLQAPVAVAGGEAGAVLALHVPPGPAGAAGLGALGPLPQHPVGHTERVDEVQGRRRGLLLLAEGHISGDEEGVLDLGGDDVAGCGQQLDGDGFPQLPEALDPLQGGGGAAVLQHGAANRDVLLHRGDGVVTVQDVASALPPDGQVVAVVRQPPVAPLLDVDVRGAHRDGDDVAVAVPAGGNDSGEAPGASEGGVPSGGGLTWPCCTGR